MIEFCLGVVVGLLLRRIMIEFDQVIRRQIEDQWGD